MEGQESIVVGCLHPEDGAESGQVSCAKSCPQPHSQQQCKSTVLHLWKKLWWEANGNGGSLVEETGKLVKGWC